MKSLREYITEARRKYTHPEYDPKMSDKQVGELHQKVIDKHYGRGFRSGDHNRSKKWAKRIDNMNAELATIRPLRIRGGNSDGGPY